MTATGICPGSRMQNPKSGESVLLIYERRETVLKNGQHEAACDGDED